ncbi:MAG: hypothetical protein CFE45_09705 [Burkholderiales bacterium PBB5]|nr:MAG: hypothetical protein CFE45_09705 [Burkholderiales bacterium PBB5]
MRHLAFEFSARPPAAVARSVVLAAVAAVSACGGSASGTDGAAAQAALVAQGQQIFSCGPIGDEAVTALSVGLKVDSDALPPAVVEGIRNGSVDLHSPATTVALLKLNAVVGLKATIETVNGVDKLARVGITCALCHATVDNAFAPGIGKRLDGWANRDLNPGAIMALSPAVASATKTALNAWGAGKFDPRHNVDGLSKAVVIPPAYGLEGIHRITVTGDGNDIAYWNRYVAVAEMGGLGTVSEPRLNLNITQGTQDLVSAKLPALQAYQLSLKAPAAPAGSFDVAAAARGKLLFEGAGRCASCHSGTTFTDANLRLHPASDSMAEPESPSYASRSATKQYRTSPLKGVWQHAPYFHDGSAATLEAVVQTYNTRQSLGLTHQQMADLAQYLKSL